MNNDFQVLRRIIAARRTDKVLGRADQPLVYSSATLKRCDELVWQALIDCGQAPFHYDRRLDDLAEPWRVYWLNGDSCRRLARSLPELIPNLTRGNKLAGLLAACGSLAVFTWLPQSPADPGEPSAEKLEQVNQEHLAATAAAVQNYLLLCTAAGLPTYWSSARLIEQHLFVPLGIATESVPERLLAAVFTHYPPDSETGTGATGAMEIVGGKLRDKRDPDHRWLKRLEF